MDIVWINGSVKPNLVLLYDNGDASHYFYWNYELTPTSIIKSTDVEPIRLNKNIVLSRLHFHGLTIWINPSLHEGKPLSQFMKNFHIPLIVMENEKIIVKYESIVDASIPLKDKPAYYAAKFFTLEIYLKLKPPKKRKISDYHSKCVVPTDEFIPNFLLFNKEYIKNNLAELIIIGKESDVDSLIHTLKHTNNNNTQLITKPSVIANLGF